MGVQKDEYEGACECTRLQNYDCVRNCEFVIEIVCGGVNVNVCVFLCACDESDQEYACMSVHEYVTERRVYRCESV